MVVSGKKEQLYIKLPNGRFELMFRVLSSLESSVDDKKALQHNNTFSVINTRYVIDKSKVGLGGVTSKIAGPEIIDESVKLPELSFVTKT